MTTERIQVRAKAFPESLDEAPDEVALLARAPSQREPGKENPELASQSSPSLKGT